jgi:hypothetical protein
MGLGPICRSMIILIIWKINKLSYFLNLPLFFFTQINFKPVVPEVYGLERSCTVSIRSCTVMYGLVRSGKILYGLVRSCTVSIRSCSVMYCIVRSGTVGYGHVRLGTVRYGHVRIGTVRYGHVRLGTVLYGLVRF